MTVYVTQEPTDNINISPAVEHGDIKILTSRSNAINYDHKNILKKIEKDLVDYNDDDCILCLGDPVIIGMVCAVAAINNDHYIKVLKWDRQERAYKLFQLNFNSYNY